MALKQRLPRARAPETRDRRLPPPLAVLALVPIVVVAGILMAIVLAPPFAGIGFGVHTLDARLTAAGAGFTGDIHFPTRSTIYASDGKTVLANIYLDNRELVHLSDVSEPARQAVLAIEDSGFYQHGALNWNSMIRALVENARAGTVVQGGSTITQQLVKNTLQNTDARTFANKFRELAISLRVEQQYTKDQIFELYLNQVYMGNGVYGIGTASRFYFHKPASKLTLTEGAMLAGILRYPGYYDPLKDPANMLLRRNDVLNRMMGLGWLSPADNEVDKAMPLGLAKHVRTLKKPKLPSFFVKYMTDQILENPHGEYDALGSTYAQRQQTLYTGGLRIYTTLNARWQAAAQTAARQPYQVYASNPGYIQKPDTSIVSIDNATGAIRTMLSGRNYAKDHKDLADRPHQLGSSFKPYILATAFEQGMPPTQKYSARSPLCPTWWKDDQGNPTCVYNAEPYGGGGFVDLYTATTSSINVVFAQLIHDVGPENVVPVAQKMGVTSLTPNDAKLALAVGSIGVSPIEHASGYETIANGGIHCTPYTVESIYSGDTLVLKHKPDCHRVLTPGIANQITGMLENVVKYGTGTAANLYTWPTAGKTGTAVLNKDVWFVGFTRQVTTAVWVGFPGNEDSLSYYFGTGVFGGTVCAPIWHAYMQAVMSSLPPEGFPAPPAVTTTPSPPASVKVPNVVGKTLAQATAILQPLGFGVNVTIVRDAAPKGTVLAQSPAGGADGIPGTNVSLQVSNGVVPRARVPNVVGLHKADATAALEAAGFVVAVVFASPPDPSNADIVVAQAPGAGTKAAIGSTVTITIGA